MNKSIKKGLAFMKKHPAYNAMTHAIGGIGIGIIIASPVAGEHPVGWGIAFMIVSLLGHLYAFFA